MQLSRGQRAKIADLIPNGQKLTLGISINAPHLVIDFACFGLDANGKLADERYMTFFNQPTTPCGGVRLETPAGDMAGFAIDLSRLPATIERLTITAALESNGAMSQINTGQVRLLDGGRETACFAFKGNDFAQERALMLLEIYRKDGVWRTCALGQGFNGGLEALVKHFGGSVAAESTPPKPAAPPPPSPVNLNKITLEKRGNSVSLAKQNQADHGELVVNLNWTMRNGAPAKTSFFGGSRANHIDLDLGCLFELTSGERSAVQALGNTFGNYHAPPYIALDADDRTGARSEGENLRINGQYWERIQRILVYAFIYEGTPNWAEANARITIKTPRQPEIEIRLDSARNDQPMCAIAMLENQRGEIKITKLVEYFRGHREVDQAYHWQLQWTRGSK
ncbi:TerD family protein [Thiospirillum jenense]|uniref:TerD family protein n=1 Tax=Thiospirillum jenense TaxID=1653858 RepID=A0A839HD17_9GAMM|nr:TerD family protein [Thiospirillum jenense]MBB1125087.1 TerD family protein [Thiospirillum jenense]